MCDADMYGNVCVDILIAHMVCHVCVIWMRMLWCVYVCVSMMYVNVYGGMCIHVVVCMCVSDHVVYDVCAWMSVYVCVPPFPCRVSAQPSSEGWLETCPDTK